MSLLYYIKNGNTIIGGYTYGELAGLSIHPYSLVCKGEEGKWRLAAEYVELLPLITQGQSYQENSSSDFVSPTNGHESHKSIDIIENKDIINANNRIFNDNHLEDYREDALPYQDNPSRQRQTHTFIPDETYFWYKKKQKKAIIGIITLGTAAITLVGIGNTWRNSLFKGTSLDKGGTGFVLRVLSFCLCLTVLSVPYFIYSILACIYYTVRIKKLRSR